MSFVILERRGLEREKRIERVIDFYAKQRATVDKKRPVDRQRKNAKEIYEESRAKLEKRGFGKRD